MRTIRDIFGPPSHQPFGFYDLDSSSVRTSQATLLSDSTGSSVTLPRWGSMCGGALYELPTPAPLTNGNGSSGLLQTPSAADAMGGHLTRGGNRSHELLLKGQVKALLPTPAVNDMGAGKTPEQWDSWTGEMREKHGNGNGHGRSLSIEAQRLLPTPSASGDARNTNDTSDYLTLSGALTRLRSEGGSSSTDQPPGQLTIADA